MSDECECGGQCGVPDNAVILNELHIVEYLDPADGVIWKVDMSHGSDGSDLMPGKYFELAEWARMMATAPILADMIDSYRGV